MAQTINLDAMIPRADFREADSEGDGSAKKIGEISLSQLGPDSFLVPSLRKPDFQRETTQWTPDQVEVFLKSFLDNELVPSIILWRSTSHIFVIDGAHRLSAILAWINDDYGDGPLSKKFYGDSIPESQKKLAKQLRARITSSIGSYGDLRKVMYDASLAAGDSVIISRANNAKSRALDLQWVEGDEQKAETSFFKINKQGTPLHKVEERLLRERRKPIAIAARSIVRAGSGHKYWAQFSPDVGGQIEKLASDVHNLLFSPELSFPIKTLNLPHGGQTSPIGAFNLLMDVLAYCESETDKADDSIYLYVDDLDGSGTLRALRLCQKVMQRITSNQSHSLGLHPAVYFYSERGRHMDYLFIAMVAEVAKALRDNDSSFFQKFTKRRAIIERIFLENKFLLYQANSLFGSKQRTTNWRSFIRKLVKTEEIAEGYTQKDLLNALDLGDRVIAEAAKPAGANFTTDTKSAIFLQESLDISVKCPGCGGLVHVERAAQYDHIVAKASGGIGSSSNGQLMHPYCNSIKGHS